MGCGCGGLGVGLRLTPGGLRLRGSDGLCLTPGLGGFEFGACRGLRLLPGGLGLRGCFGFGADLCGLSLRGGRGLRLAPGLGGLELRASLGFRLQPCGLGLRRSFGLRLSTALGGKEGCSSRELHLTSGLGGFGLGLRSPPGLGCFRGSECHCPGLEPGGLRLGRCGGFGLGLQPGRLGRCGGFGLGLQPGRLGRCGRLCLGPFSGGFGLRLDPRGLGHGFRVRRGLDLGLDPGCFRVGERSSLCLCLDPSGLRLGEFRGFGHRRGFGRRRGFDLGPQPRLDIGLDSVHRRGRSSHAQPSQTGHDVNVRGVLGRASLAGGCRDRGVLDDVCGRPGQRVERRDILDGGVPVGVGHHRATGVVEIGERGGEHLLAEEGSARQAPALGRVPAVAARVLPARHAEVERLVERVQLLRRDLAVGLVARRGKGLVHGRVVRQDEVLEPARDDP